MSRFGKFISSALAGVAMVAGPMGHSEFLSSIWDIAYPLLIIVVF